MRCVEVASSLNELKYNCECSVKTTESISDPNTYLLFETQKYCLLLVITVYCILAGVIEYEACSVQEHQLFLIPEH